MPLANRPHPVNNMHAKLNAILHSKDLSNADKRDRLRLLIPADVLEISDLRQATPVQLRKLQDAIEVAQAIQRVNAEIYGRGDFDSLMQRRRS
jgi:hypothetical protein